MPENQPKPSGFSILSIIHGLGRINQGLSRAGRTLSVVFLMAMLGIVLLQVLFRYALNDSLIWTEELAKALMVWSAFLVAPWAYRRGAAVAILMLITPLPVRLQAALKILIDALVLWILFVLFELSFGFVARGADISAASLPIPMAFFYAIMPIGLLTLMSVAIEHLLRGVMHLIDPDGGYPLAPARPVIEGE
ncbi:hypothetical protein JCM17846_19690 [Iodidimonas nitroreducens]|uniref:TRAP transporter small permease protein n=1 Tax=Iodidimonas nitroreducens TaxID=1236968 RepID=A0A5A7N8L1_9PROT|nr:TRAP transporter small permease [Iodidimonas nitroreducens]GAK33181.1 putative TRAP transporter small permease protein [alpha proteobacterium Q-1]GER04287.1 hypothetical protein JCM17846_19690 [Iodidimonas nitroreducens]